PARQSRRRRNRRRGRLRRGDPRCWCSRRHPSAWQRLRHLSIVAAMSLTIATWNINSVRLRIANVERFLKLRKPDVLCLQETKCPDEFFPHRPFERLGYTHRLVQGMKSYNGVAILSKIPYTAAKIHHRCGKEDCRHVEAALDIGGDGLDRRAAPLRAGEGQAVFMVELPQPRLAQVQPWPSARPYPRLARPFRRPQSHHIDIDLRGWKLASDHVPVLATFDV